MTCDATAGSMPGGRPTGTWASALCQAGRCRPGTGCGRECSPALCCNMRLVLAQAATSAPTFVPSGRSIWSAAAPGTGGTAPPFVREVFLTAGRVGFFWLFILVSVRRLVPGCALQQSLSIEPTLEAAENTCVKPSQKIKSDLHRQTRLLLSCRVRLRMRSAHALLLWPSLPQAPQPAHGAGNVAPDVLLCLVCT
jgi:hypothetical protein